MKSWNEWQPRKQTSIGTPVIISLCFILSLDSCHSNYRVPVSGGLSKIVAKLLTSCVWGQKFTLNNPMEYLLDLFKFFPEALEGQDSQFSPFFHGLSLKRQSALGTLRGSDTFNLHQASTLRSKGIHRHPYCRVLSLKRWSGLVTFGDLWRVLGGPDTVRDHQGLTLRSKGTI